MSLAEARKKFTDDYAAAWSAGQEPNRPKPVQKSASLQDLFTAYIGHLEHEGKRSGRNQQGRFRPPPEPPRL
jgi:hypothetical protein